MHGTHSNRRPSFIQRTKLRHHKATGQAYVVLNGRYLFFGPYGSPDVVEQYHRTIAEWRAAGKNPPSEAEQTTINELIARYWKHVEEYYRAPDGILALLRRNV